MKPIHAARRSSIIFRIGTIFLSIILCALPAIRPGHTQDDLPPADPRFGAVETYHAPDLADEARVGWTRILFYWSELEREGPDDWNVFHAPLERIDREIEGGREVVGMLVHTPAWATDGKPGAGVPRGLYLPVDDPDNVWASFVRDVTAAYQGRVDRWIIWNEPDIPIDTYGAQWEGTTEDYYQLVKVAYLAAHEINPDVRIHLGGLTYWHAKNYLHDFLSIAGADPTANEHHYYFDVVSTHIYFQPDTTQEIVNSLQQTLAEFNLDQPIWLNEMNAPPYDDPNHVWDEPLFPVTQEMQASFLLQEFALALSEGIERIAVYKWIDQPPPVPGSDAYGLLRADSDPRPAMAAFQVITQHYAGVEATHHIDEPEMHEVVLARGRHTTRIMWARSGLPVVVVIPALSTSGKLIEQDGGETQAIPLMGHYLFILRGATCMPGYGCFIGGPPLLLVEEALADLSPGSPACRSFSVTSRTLMIGGAAGLGMLGAAALVGYRLKKWYLRMRKNR
ncbi:MAG: hypothetical protein JXB07_13795 [Anaerolineae bacterium]|nr:hypothetical protein [Anaerolineae bacterium]